MLYLLKIKIYECYGSDNKTLKFQIKFSSNFDILWPILSDNP